MLQIAPSTTKKIEIFQGDSLDVEFQITDKVRKKPVDLNKYDVRFVVTDLDGTVIITKVSTNPLEIEKTDLLGGIATVFIKPADTLGLEISPEGTEFKFDAEIFDGTDVFTFCKGIFLVKC